MIRKINFQPMTKAEVSDGCSLLIHSIFFTIQGEGPNVGMPAVFVRLGGCNLQCPGCDTEYSKGAAIESIESILTRVQMAFGDYKGQRLVVITGGEPFRQQIEPLCSLLHLSGMIIQVETNGTLGLQGHEYDYPIQIVVSPKAGKVHPTLYPYITAYKYVLDSNNVDLRDGLPTSVLGMPAAPARPHEGFGGYVYVQPADESNGWTNAGNCQAAITSAMKFGYRLCLQTHKIVGLD